MPATFLPLRYPIVQAPLAGGPSTPSASWRASVVAASERDDRIVLSTDATSGLSARHVVEAQAIGAVTADSNTIVARLRVHAGDG